MKFTCEKNELQKAVSLASQSVATKNAIPALEGVLVEACENTVKVSGYDMKLCIKSYCQADVTEQGAIVINAKMLDGILSKAPDDIVCFEVDDNNIVTIKCGKSKTQLNGFPADDYPELPDTLVTNTSGIGIITLPEKELKKLIASTCFAVSDNDARPVHTGELFEVVDNTLTVVAVDGFRLALEEFSLDTEDVDFVIPSRLLNEVKKACSSNDKNVDIYLYEHYVVFKFENVIFASRLLEGAFLDYRKAIPVSQKYKIVVSRKSLLDAVERVALLINDKIKSPIRVSFSNGKVHINVATALGTANDECDIESGEIDEFEIGFNSKYLIEALKAISDEDIEMNFDSPTTPCVITPVPDSESRFKHMILPVRLRNE